MSRYALAPLPGFGRVDRVAIGWDRPLRTFFVQVFGRSDDDGDEEMILWVGTAPGELKRVADAIALVRRYAVVPDELAERLEADHRDGHDRRDGPAQIEASRFICGPGKTGGEGER